MIKPWIGGLLGVLLCSPVVPAGATVIFFSTTDTPVQSPGAARVCYLDKVTNIQQKFRQLALEPSNLNQQSEQVLMARYAPQLQALGTGMRCQFRAAQLGVTRLPAVVIDRRYVIYGQTDVMQALAQYQQYRRAHHETL